MDALDDPPRETIGYLWFLRITAIVAIPMYGMATVVGAAAAAGVIALLGRAAARASVIAVRLPQGRLQFALAGVILAVLTGLCLWASAR